MKAFADAVNNPSEGSLYTLGGQTFENENVVLDTGIDLNNEEWTPIGQTGYGQFKGTFDGQGHTIKNLNSTRTLELNNDDNEASGLFGWLNNKAHIRNVVLQGLNISGNEYAGGIAGYSEVNGTSASIENCVIKNSVISGVKHVGGVIGVINELTTISNNTVENCTIKNVSDPKVGHTCGGLIGWNYNSNNIITNNKVIGTTIEYKNESKGSLTTKIGELFGCISWELPVDANNVTNGNTIISQ